MLFLSLYFQLCTFVKSSFFYTSVTKLPSYLFIYIKILRTAIIQSGNLLQWKTSVNSFAQGDWGSFSCFWRSKEIMKIWNDYLTIKQPLGALCFEFLAIFVKGTNICFKATCLRKKQLVTRFTSYKVDNPSPPLPCSATGKIN